VPIHFKVKNVFPIEDGIIVKAAYNKDIIHFDSLNAQPESLRKPKLDHTYAYFTLTNHPLDDIYPLSLGGKNHLIDTHLDILYVSYKIPFVVFYNWETRALSFGFLKNKQEEL
jgi:hypothetical protein